MYNGAVQMMKKYRSTLLAVSMTLLPMLHMADGDASARQSDNLQVTGYLQAMPLWMELDMPPQLGIEQRTFWEYRLQNRLNLRWDAAPSVTFNWQMRTRLFAGDLVEQLPFYADAIDRDEGWANLSWMPVRHDRLLIHYIPDRLYSEWRNDNWTVRLGRQRINWGINTVTNPNDLFNIYSFYDFDYPERPGSDAIRIQHYTGTFSRWELALRPGRQKDQTAAALLYGFNRRGYDIQLIGGYYRRQLALGGGWAGSIDQTGFKGEVMLFEPLTELPDRDTGLVIGLSIDHMFSNSIFLILEGVYNRAGGQLDLFLHADAFSADNPSLSRFQWTGQASYPFSPILNGSVATIWYPDEQALFLSPSITWSMHQDIDLNLITQIFTGSGDSPLANAGQTIATSLKWNF